jgi:hypothetical protein
VTNFDTVAVGHASTWLGRAALAIILGLGLAGCETAGGLFSSGSSGDSDVPPAAVAVAPAPVKARIAVAPIIGAPENISRQLSQQLVASMERQKIVVTKTSAEPSDYTLRGYIVASKDRSAIKISYIWDVTDPAGKRVNRITGEELVADGGARDAWSVVGPNLTQTIADKTATQFSSWVPPSGPAVAHAMPPPTSGATGTPSPAVASAEPPPVRPTAASAVPPAGGPATGSITRPAVAIVPVVTGAPGDGNAALAAALARELSSSSATLVDAKGAPLRIEGRVVVGAPKDGKQPITIDWRVRDTEGRALGTVSQKNDIPQGSLDGEWGRTADAAAAAAAQGIIKLIPTRSAAN